MAKDCNFYRVHMKNVRVYLELDHGNMSALLQQQGSTKISLSITKLGTESFLDRDGSVWEFIPASTKTFVFVYSISPHPVDKATFSFRGAPSSVATSVPTAEFCPFHNGMEWNCDTPAGSPFGLWEVAVPDDDDVVLGRWPQGLSLSAVAAIKFEFGLIYREIDPRKLTAMFVDPPEEDPESNSFTCTGRGVGRMPAQCKTCTARGSLSSLQASSPARDRPMSSTLLALASALVVVTVLLYVWRRNARQRRLLL